MKSQVEKNKNKKREKELPFTDRELKVAINQQKNTAPGEHTIHPQMIKKTTTRDTENLLDIYNNIWEKGKIPKIWKHAIITPLLKEV